MLLPRMLLCLALFAPYAGLAQGSTEAPAPAPSQPEPLPPPPLITAPEDPEAAPPEGELFPHEFESTRTAGEPFSVGRGVFEFVGGGVAGAGIGFLGLLLGAAVFVPGCNDDDDCIVPIFLLGSTAAAFGVPLGVYGAAKLWDGEGSYWAAFLGTVVGTGLAILVSVAAQDSGAAAVSLTTAPIIGAMVGYELSHAYVQPSVSPMLGRTLTGGVVAGISARF
jgi:hypothetical protein